MTTCPIFSACLGTWLTQCRTGSQDLFSLQKTRTVTSERSNQFDWFLLSPNHPFFHAASLSDWSERSILPIFAFTKNHPFSFKLHLFQIEQRLWVIWSFPAVGRRPHKVIPHICPAIFEQKVASGGATSISDGIISTADLLLYDTCISDAVISTITSPLQ